MKKILKHLGTDWYKYLLELIVITAGVLGAFALNSWNEENKSLQQSRDILIDVKENVDLNTAQFQKDIETNKEVINSIDIILTNLTVTKVYTDSLEKHFRYASWWATAIWRSSGYEALIDHGVDIVESKELSNSIVELFEITYPLIAENTRLAEGNWIAILPSWLEHIDRDASDFTSAAEHGARPFDYQELLESRVFRSMLTFMRSQRLVEIHLRESAIEKNQELIELINMELE